MRWSAASPRLQRTGLLGSVHCRLNGALGISGIKLRRTRAGRYTLSFPAYGRRKRRGFYLRPLSDEVRRELEDQILAALGLEEAAR